jgi:uncharacterized protein
MAYLEKQLYVRESTLPGAGKGLFTKNLIPKGKRIIEYRGEVMKWKDAEKMADDRNGYVFYITAQYVIDAWSFKKELARYANDAKGLTKVKGIVTNCEYIIDRKARRCFITAIADIPARSELFVEYGAEYWEAIRYNIRVEKRAAARKKLKNAKAREAKKLRKVTKK